MVQIGELSWKVKVDNAGKAKEQAQQVEEKVNDAKDAAEAADEQTRQYGEGMSRMAEAKERAGRVTDRLNAKMGFLGSALSGVITTLAGLIGGLTALKALILGAGIAAAVVALAVAFRENFGGMRDHVMNFVDWLQSQFEAAKTAVLSIWNSFMEGFSMGGGSLGDVEQIFGAVLDGIQQGLERFWNVAQPIWNAFVGVVIEVAGAVGQALGGIVDALAQMEGSSGVITTVVSWLTTLAAVAATVWAAMTYGVPIVMSVYGALTSVVGALGSLYGGLTTAASAITTVVGILGGPLTVAILAVVAIVAALAAAFYTNFGGIRDYVMDIMTGIASFLQQVLGRFVDFFQTHIGRLVSLAEVHLGPLITEFQATFNAIMTTVEPILRAILSFNRYILSALVPIWENQLMNILNIVMPILDTISLFIVQILDGIITTIRVALAVIRGDWEGAWDIIAGFVERTFSRINQIIGNYVSIIGAAVQLVVDTITAPFRAAYNLIVGNSLIPDMVQGVADVFNGAVDMIGGAVDSVVGAITAPFEGALETVQGIADSIGSAAEGAMDAAGSAADAAGSAASGAVDTATSAASGAADAAGNAVDTAAGYVPSFDTGGMIEETGLAQVHAGEAVIPADITKEFKQSGGGGSGKTVQVNVGGIEIGDQSLDLSNLTRREMKQLADMLAERLGDEVRSTVT